MSGRNYSDWTQLLQAHFFHEGNQDRPITLFVDDEVLFQAAKAESEEDAVVSFENAVRSWLAPSGNPFSRIYRDAKRWRANWATGGLNPGLPLLAASVLGAARMAHTQNTFTTDYYTWFARIVDRDKTQMLQQHYADTIPELWDDLSDWLDGETQGKYGRSTIRRHSAWTRIGQALSQALMRQSDRDRLPDFFRVIGFRPGEQLEPEAAVAYFRRWALRVQLSPGARRFAENRSYEEQLAQVLVQAAADWDGTYRDEEGRRTGRIAVVLDFDDSPGGDLCFYAQRPETFPLEADFQLGSQRSFELRSTGGAWYDTSPLDLPLAVALSSGIKLRSGRSLSLQFKPEPVVPLRQDNSGLGRWAATSRLELSIEHRLLVQTAFLTEVEAFLRKHAREGHHRHVGCRNLPPSYVLFDGVAVDRLPDEELPEELASLLPAPSVRPTFSGGLRIELAGATYLVGGEPDLIVPPEAAAIDPRVVIDDQERTVGRAGGQIALSALGLADGSHTVVAGLTTRTFISAVAGAKRVPSGTGSVGFEIWMRDGGYIVSRAGAEPLEGTTADITITGALVKGDPAALPPTTPQPVILPGGRREYSVLGARPGQVLVTHQPAAPGWMKQLNLRPTGFEVYPDFEPAWILLLGHSGEWSAIERSSGGVAYASISEDAEAKKWAWAILRARSAKVKGTVQRWQEFVLAATDMAF